MNQRGFTVVEVLVALVLSGVVFGLLLGVIVETRNVSRNMAQEANQLVIVCRLLNELDQYLTPAVASESFVFDGNRLEFTTRSNNQTERVVLEQSSDQWILTAGNRVPITFKGSLKFSFLQSEYWLEEWQQTGMPKAVLIRCIPNSVIEKKPYELVVNLFHPDFETVEIPAEFKEVNHVNP